MTNFIIIFYRCRSFKKVLMAVGTDSLLINRPESVKKNYDNFKNYPTNIDF